MINKVLLIGRLTKDPELRKTQQGNSVTSFTLAVDRGFDTQDGQSADFISCVCWNKQADNVSRYCSKGSLIAVDGSIRTRNYENQQGQRIYVTEVLANFVQFLETKKDSKPTYHNDTDNIDYDNGYDGIEIQDDDLPF